MRGMSREGRPETVDQRIMRLPLEAQVEIRKDAKRRGVPVAEALRDFLFSPASSKYREQTQPEPKLPAEERLKHMRPATQERVRWLMRSTGCTMASAIQQALAVR